MTPCMVRDAVFGSQLYWKIPYIRIQFTLIETILIFNAHIVPNNQIHKTSTREGLIKNRLTGKLIGSIKKDQIKSI